MAHVLAVPALGLSKPVTKSPASKERCPKACGT